VTIASGGVLPNMHAVLMPKKGAGEKEDKAPKAKKDKLFLLDYKSIATTSNSKTLGVLL
jgi:hypothetical protein